MAATSRGVRVLVVRAGGFVCAWPVARVGETLRPVAIEGIPRGAPAWVIGAALVRGAELPVVDLGRLLAGPDSSRRRLVTLRPAPGEETCVGVAVDEVLGVRSLDPRAFDLAFAVEDVAVAAPGAPSAELLAVLGCGRVVGEQIARAWA